MSLNKIIHISNKNRRNKSPSDLDLIKSHITVEEIDSNPIIKNVVKRIRKIKLNSITNGKPHLTPVKNIKDEKEIKLVDNIDCFRKIFYDYNINQKVLKNDEPKVYRGEKKYNFSKCYQFVKKKNNLEQKQMLEEIQGLYKNKDISLPTIDTNLFNGNLLILNESSIKNSIDNKVISDKSNKNSLGFLKKMQKNINNQIIGKDIAIFPRVRDSNKDMIKNRFGKDIMITKQLKELKENIPKSKKYINNIMETINYIDELDYFFDSNNQEYLNHLKNPESKKMSKFSTRVNSALFEFPEKNKSNNNIDIYKLRINKNKYHNLETIKKDKSCPDIFDKNKYHNLETIKQDKSCPDISDNNKMNINKNSSSNNINIYDINYKETINKSKILNKNNSMDKIKEDTKNNLIKLKKMYLNGNINNINTTNNNKKIINLQIQTNEKTLFPDKRISIKVQKPDTYDKLIHLFPTKNKHLKDSLKLVKKKLINNKNEKSNLEKLYEKIKQKEDYLESNDLIVNYLEKRRYNMNPKISPIDICNHYQNMRENIFRNDYFKKYIKLKKLSGYDESTYENIEKEYDSYLKKLNNMGEDINKIISNI